MNLSSPKNVDHTTNPLAEQLRHRLATLPYPAFVMCIVRILKHLGYADIRLAVGSASIPTNLGVVALIARRETPLFPEPVLIQLKHYKRWRSVSRRFVDALRGSMFEQGIQAGLSISTVAFSEDALTAVHGYPGQPIECIDGESLGRLAVDARIGLAEKQDPITGVHRHELDEEWFEMLERYCDGFRRCSTKRPADA